MNELERVIKGLKYIHDVRDWSLTECKQDAMIRRNITGEAIALLKAQEPVEPIRKPEIFDSLYFCGKCSAKVGFQMRKDGSWRFKCKFCPNCGRAVKWND